VILVCNFFFLEPLSFCYLHILTNLIRLDYSQHCAPFVCYLHISTNIIRLDYSQACAPFAPMDLGLLQNQEDTPINAEQICMTSSELSDVNHGIYEAKLHIISDNYITSSLVLLSTMLVNFKVKKKKIESAFKFALCIN
jgi:hypothetical protein